MNQEQINNLEELVRLTHEYLLDIKKREHNNAWREAFDKPVSDSERAIIIKESRYLLRIEHLGPRKSKLNDKEKIVLQEVSEIIANLFAEFRQIHK